MTPDFERFIRPARARPQIWRLLLGVVVMVAVYAGFLGAVFGLLVVTDSFGGRLPDVGELMNTSRPVSLSLLLATFIGMAVAPMVAAPLLHRRGVGTLFGRGARVLRDFVLSAAVVLALLGVYLLVWLIFFDPVPALPFERWVLFLPLALGLLVIQTGAEELVFRGYLQQQLAARFASPLVWAVLPSFLFGLAHFAPEEAGPNVWIGVGITGLFGLLAADLTAKTGSIGAAWGFHFANNCMALLVLATDGTLTGLALYLTPYAIDDPVAVRKVLVLDAAVMVTGWWLIRRLAGRS